MPADFPVQATHAIHRPASPDRQIGHVETLRRVVWILPAQGQQIVDGNAKLILRIPAEVLRDKSRRETVKAGSDGGVGGEQVSRPRGGQRDLERLRGLLHETTRAFQHREGGVPFIQVTDFRTESERGQQPPSPNPEDHLLLESQLRPTPIQFAGDPAMSGKVRRVIAVQQVELDPADLDLPGAQPDRVTRQSDLQSQPLAVRLAQRRDRQLAGVIIGEEGLLRPVLVDYLPKIALLVEQSHADHRHAEVAGGLELIASHITQSA